MKVNIVFSIFFLFAPIFIFAQAEENVEVQIKIIELGYNGKKRDPVFKFYLDSINGKSLNANNQCFAFSRKDDTKRFTPDKDTSLRGKNGWLNPIVRNGNTQTQIKVWMLGFDKSSKGEVCTFSKKDEKYGTCFKSIELNAFVLGNYSDTITLIDSLSGYYAKIQLKSSLPKPKILKPSVSRKIYPANEKLSFISGFPVQNRRGLRFQWEYALGENDTWRSILKMPKDTFSIEVDPLEHFFEGKLKQTQPVLLRLKAISKDTFSTSEIFYTYFTPKVPGIEKTDIRIGKSCKDIPTGTIVLNNIIAEVDQLAYVIVKRSKSQEIGSCNLINPREENCKDLVKHDKIIGKSLDIKRLPVGDYALLLYNSGMEIDQNYKSIPFEIEPFTSFTLEDFEIRNPDCEDPRPGELSFNLKGGDWERANIVLEPATGSLERTMEKVSFKNLAGNSYSLTVADGCGSTLKEKFTIYNEAPTLEIESLDALKTKAGVGVDYRVVLKNGEGPFKVTFKDSKGRLVTETKLAPDFIINLPLGKVDLNIIDEKDQKCMRVDRQIEVSQVK